MRVKKNYCESCHFNFFTTTLFFEHRVGTFDPLTRRCLTEAEMQALGWVCQPMDVVDQGMIHTWSEPGQIEKREQVAERITERFHR